MRLSPRQRIKPDDKQYDIKENENIKIVLSVNYIIEAYGMSI